MHLLQCLKQPVFIHFQFIQNGFLELLENEDASVEVLKILFKTSF